MKQHLIYLREEVQHVKRQGTRLVLIERMEPVACVAIKEDGAASAYQISECSHMDRFDRPLVRQMAEGRLAKKPIACPLPLDGGFWNTTRTVVLSIANDSKMSKRTRRAAETYLSEQTERVRKLAENGELGVG